MRLLGNIFWVLICGLILSLLWALAGLLWCITVVGIPVGMQCFKFAALSLWPFGRDIEYRPGLVSMLFNVLWIIFGGLEICLCALIIGALLCITVIGIPFGLQCFKIAKLALLPFGAHIVRIGA